MSNSSPHSYNLRKPATKVDLIKTPTVHGTYSQTSTQLRIEDFTCCICFEILIEPVRLCMPCLKTLVYNKSLKCPMCRQKIRLGTGRDKLISCVNLPRWDLIRREFAVEVNRRINADIKKAQEEHLNTKLIKKIVVSIDFWVQCVLTSPNFLSYLRIFGVSYE